MDKPPLILLVGPTAVGKTEAAIQPLPAFQPLSTADLRQILQIWRR